MKNQNIHPTAIKILRLDIQQRQVLLKLPLSD